MGMRQVVTHGEKAALSESSENKFIDLVVPVTERERTSGREGMPPDRVRSPAEEERDNWCPKRLKTDMNKGLPCITNSHFNYQNLKSWGKISF